jgi:tRNA modification GTPase
VGLLTELRIYVESAIDFPEEEIDFLADGQVQSRLTEAQAELKKTQQAARQGNLLREGWTGNRYSDQCAGHHARYIT